MQEVLPQFVLHGCSSEECVVVVGYLQCNSLWVGLCERIRGF